MDWLDAAQALRAARTPSVIVTVATVRGHAPRNGGAKMVVSATATFGTVGGGNLEATVIARARELLGEAADEPELMKLTLSDRVATEYGVQCCGGEVTMLLEPVLAVPVVAVFGVGHVGLELARILVRQRIELHLVDSRPEMLAPERIGVPGSSGPLADAVATVLVHGPQVPESALMLLPTGAHVLVMTHDHVEDLAIIEAALGTDGLASIGLIGSRSKWARFEQRLREAGHEDASLARVATPIGIDGIGSKDPAAIAVSVAARVLQQIEEQAVTRGHAEQGRTTPVAPAPPAPPAVSARVAATWTAQ
ncbi:xanthine dehydrogenase accessory protein XdhC [Agromyces sp. Leaf222]|uniref:xanthine dehydrogenase accessory protein XdhC n=1 Tax=Agromyces sp. Leaf222 TaxID=1735688 RepID=UPI0009EC294C|nr:xanthine dehydrogenase accessory protein XdhC [Agromyces sp. Leaf222]